MISKTPIAIAIETTYSSQRYASLKDFYVQTRIGCYTSPYMAIYGRRFGKTYFSRYQRLLQQAQSLSAGSTLKVYKGRTPRQNLQRIVSYDPGNQEDYSVGCVFERDPATGTFTLISTHTMERYRKGEHPSLYVDGWPEAMWEKEAFCTPEKFRRYYMCSYDRWPYTDE